MNRKRKRATNPPRCRLAFSAIGNGAAKRAVSKYLWYVVPAFRTEQLQKISEYTYVRILPGTRGTQSFPPFFHYRILYIYYYELLPGRKDENGCVRRTMNAIFFTGTRVFRFIDGRHIRICLLYTRAYPHLSGEEKERKKLQPS